MAITGGRDVLDARTCRVGTGFHNGTGFGSAAGTKTASVGLNTLAAGEREGPMRERKDHKEESCPPHRTAAVLARAERVAERLLRPADELDYRVRRWLRPVTAGTPSPLRIQGSTPRREFLGHIQDAIGRNLRAEHVLEQSMPDRLANLLREFEQQSNKLRPYPETA
jgi:hypothetical protein